MSDDVKYNAKKSAIMILRSATLKGCSIPEFKLKGVTLHVVATHKYLGNYISDDLSDDDDINRQRRTLYVQGNIVLQKCIMCSLEVKLTLFRSVLYKHIILLGLVNILISALWIYYTVFAMYPHTSQSFEHNLTRVNILGPCEYIRHHACFSLYG